MQLKWGSYSFDENATVVGVKQETLINEGGQPYAVRVTAECQGYLSGSSQSDLTSAETSLRNALARSRQDLILYRDDGSSSGVALRSAGSITGTRVVRGPDFPGTQGPEYATERAFTFAVEAEYPLAGSQLLLLSWTETLSFSGGGPLYIVKPALVGPPQRQLLYAQTPYQATQSGEAVGYLAYPNPAQPVWPASLRQAPRVQRRAPRRRGNGYEEYAVAWEYEFESVTPLVGVPTLWR